MSDYQANIIIKNPATPTGPASTGRAPGIWKLSDVAQWVKQGVWPDSSVVADQYFPYVSLLLSSTSLGNANNNLFIDSSGAFAPVSRFGNPTQGSVTPYSANWSNYFDGSGDYLTAPSNVAFALGTGDFTIEAWIFSNDTSFMLFASQTGGGVGFGYNIDNGSQGLWLGRVGQGPDATSGVQLTYNQWNHIAVTRQSGSVKFFVNGVQSGSTQTVTVNYGTSAQGFYVGRDLGSSFDFAGYASNARLVKGTAVYTGNFTVPTSPLTAISGTSLLTCQSNRFRDNSGNSFALTVTGNTSVSDFSPFSPSYPGISYNQNDITNWSGYFDGGGDSLGGASWSAAGNFGTSDFTVEGWFHATSAPQGNNVIWSCNIYPNSTGLYLRYLGGGPTDLDVRYGNTAIIVASAGWSLNEWHHIAVVRSSGTLTLYIDGVSRGSASFTNNCTDGLQYIGRPSDTSNFAFQGYISNFRIVKGTAVYTSAFTPSTTNLSAISGTSLLTLQSATFKDNSTNNYAITPNGEVTVTGNSPFNTVGYWSTYFDGSGDYLSAPYNSAFAFNGNFTVECWINYSSHGAYGGIISNANPGGFSGGWQIIFNNTADTLLVEYTGGSFTSSTALTRNTWNHIAFVRNGSAMTLYINGVSVGTATSSTTFDSGSYPTRIGVERDVSHYVTGHISNVRIVKGTAVYTANFTPPTSPLTAISGTSLVTCQNGRFVDNSSNAFPITQNGNVSAQSFDPFYTATIASNGGSMYFDGTGDYLNVGVPSDWTFLHNGQVNWTLEYWAYNNNNTTRQDSFSTNTNSTNGAFGITVYQFSSTAQIGVQIVNGIDGNNFNCITTNSPLAPNCWNHVAVTFVTSTKTLNIYVNGVLCATTTNASYSFGSSAPNFTMQVGRWIGSVSGNGGYWNGYIANARIVKGEILYTSTFTPATAPQNVTPATVLSLNGMNAGIYDATAINDMETVGNAQVSTVQSKFGGSSVYFDGTGDYLSTRAGSDLMFGTGDVTLECWLYLNSTAGTQTIAARWATPRAWLWQFTSSTMTVYFGTTGTSFSWSPATGTWYHLAITRSSGNTRFFVNGLQTGSTQTNNGDATNTGIATIGINDDGVQQPLNGYIDDFRITKGYARYTSNFTPPDKAFPTY